MSAFACLSSSPAELAISLSHSFHARAHTRTHARTHARTHLPGARTCTVTDGACVTVAGVAAVPAPRHADAGPPRPRERAAAHAVYLAAVLLLRQHRVQGLLLCLLFACASTSRCSLVALSLLSRCSLVALSLLSRCSLVTLFLCQAAFKLLAVFSPAALALCSRMQRYGPIEPVPFADATASKTTYVSQVLQGLQSGGLLAAVHKRKKRV
jgi:hypothetical protein